MSTQKALAPSRYCQAKKGLVIHAFVIIPSHIHLVVSTKEGGEPLSGIIRDFKKHTSKEIVKAVQTIPESRREWLLRAFGNAGKHNPNNTNYQVWQQDSHPVELVTLKFTRQKVDYVHLDPVASPLRSLTLGPSHRFLPCF